MMKKEEIKQLLGALVPTIKKVVQMEMKKVVRPLIKEEVDRRIDKILAEHFLKNVGKQALAESPSKLEEVDLKIDKAEREKRRLALRESLMKKMGVDKNPMLEGIYGDIDASQLSSMSTSTFAGETVYVDGEDEGVDLSLFMGR